MSSVTDQTSDLLFCILCNTFDLFRVICGTFWQPARVHKMGAASSKCIQLRAPEPLNLSQVGSLGCLVVLVGGMRVLEASVCIYAQYLGRIRMTNRRLDAYSIDVSLFTNTTHESGDDNTIFLVRCSKKGPFSRLLLLSQQYHFTYLKIVKKS